MEIYERLGALSEPIRVRLLCLLEAEELGVGELTQIAQLPQSTVSRHLKRLRLGGWIEGRKEGAASYFRVPVEGLDEEARALWRLVREQVEGTAQMREDMRRLERVVAAREVDTRAFFGRGAARWDAVREELFGSRPEEAALLSLIPARWALADLGCGTGRAMERLARVARKVIGVDREPAMLEAAAQRLAEVENAELRQGELDALPLRDDEVDATLCVLVLHHVEDAARALGEARRVTRRGGPIVVMDMVGHSRAAYRHTMGHRHLGFSEARLRALAAEGGLTVTRYEALPPDPEAQGPGLFVAALACEG